MSRNRRALATAALAAVAGVAGVTLAGEYSDSASRQYGALRPVVVMTESLSAGTILAPERVGRSVEVRRIPVRFAPAGAFVTPGQVAGLRTRVDLVPGSYLTAAMVGPPEIRKGREAGPRRGIFPVEVSVHGAGALPGRGRRVDVLVSRPDAIGGDPGTRVAARSAVLLDLAPQTEVGAEPGTGRVTLGLSRRAAIGLVDAEAAGRRITLIPARPG